MCAVTHPKLPRNSQRNMAKSFRNPSGLTGPKILSYWATCDMPGTVVWEQLGKLWFTLSELVSQWVYCVSEHPHEYHDPSFTTGEATPQFKNATAHFDIRKSSGATTNFNSSQLWLKQNLRQDLIKVEHINEEWHIINPPCFICHFYCLRIIILYNNMYEAKF